MTRPALHSGQHIANEPEALDMSVLKLAKDRGIPSNRITGIIRGRRGITADTALRLGMWLGTSPEFWMNLQKNYEFRSEEAEHGEEIWPSDIPHHAA